MKQRYDVVIVGGGITGLAIAALLVQSRHAGALRLTVIDAAPRPRFNPDDDIALRVSAISTGSAHMLDAAGAWDAVIHRRACPYEHMRVWDGEDDPEGPSTLCFDADEFAVPQLGFIVENVLLQDAILKVLDRGDVNLRFDTPIADITPADAGYSVKLEDGRELDADLLIGADGVRSLVRESAGIEATRRHYAQTAFVTHLRPQESHAATARQRFLDDGPLGMLPLSDGRISVVWSTTHETARQAMSASDDELGRMLTEASDQVLGELAAAGPRGTFPLCAQHARNYVLPRLALIGDAAHAVHPLAGQGANLGLADARTLCTVIEEAIDKGDHPGDRPVLRRYERARKGHNATMLHLMTGLNQLFAASSPTIGELRRAGMRLFNVSGPLRERAVKVALGAGRR
jgi:2-octaprenylphenol hydroxylase